MAAFEGFAGLHINTLFNLIKNKEYLHKCIGLPLTKEDNLIKLSN